MSLAYDNLYGRLGMRAFVFGKRDKDNKELVMAIIRDDETATLDNIIIPLDNTNPEKTAQKIADFLIKDDRNPNIFFYKPPNIPDINIFWENNRRFMVEYSDLDEEYVRLIKLAIRFALNKNLYKKPQK